MPGPVERWLGTFMCKQYADIFEVYGFKTLHSVCQLQLATLHSMGIPPEHCDKILENVCVLRQSLVGSIGPGYPEHDYDPQMGGNSQGSNYSYHSSPGYPPSHQQYGNTSGHMSHSMSYAGNDSYNGGPGHYASSSHQDVYPQSLYNSRLHGGHGAWDDPMSVYNHPSRHGMATGLQPTASIMRSPPPPSSSSSSSSLSMGLPHYPRHVIMDSLPPSAHHHTWSAQGQMLSPRATPSPGMARPASSLSSPSLANCSPAHSSSKPFSPPPYSPHPPPAHQQHSPASYSDYPPPPPSAPILSPGPSIGPPSRPMSHPSSVSSSSPSDPLQSLQKMVFLDTQNLRTISLQTNNPLQQQPQQQKQPLPDDVDEDDGNDVRSMKSSIMKIGPKFSSVEQLASPSPSLSVASQKSSNVGTPSPMTPSHPPCQDDSNDGSTIEVGGRMSVETLNSPQTCNSDLRSGLKLEEGEVADDNSLLDVVGHERSTDANVKVDRKKVGPFRGRKKEVIQQQQNGYLPALKGRGCGDSEHVLETSDTSKVIANGIMSDSYRGSEVDDAGKRTDLLVNDSGEQKPPSRNRNRRKQCVSQVFMRSPASPLSATSPSSFYTNANNFASNEEMCSSYKVNGDGEKVELTELKPVKRFSSDQGKLLSVTSAMEIVRNCDQQIQGGGCPPTTSCFPTTSDNIKLEDSSGRRANIVQPGLVATVEHIRGAELDVNGTSKTVIITTPTSILNSARVSVLKQGSQLGASFKMDSPQVSCTPTTHYNNDTSLSMEEREALMKPRRGRPPGSKNKPKPPGFEKEPRKVAKQKLLTATTVVVGGGGGCGGGSSTAQRITSTTAAGAPRQTEVNKNTSKLTIMPANVVQLPVVRKNYQQLSDTMRPRGPYIRLGGRNRNIPSSVTVVNTIIKDEEGDSKGLIRGSGRGRGRLVRKWPLAKSDGESGQLKKMTNMGFNSTMSANYDVFTKDKTWVCSLCKKGSHYKGLGDLFGPYLGRLEGVESTDFMASSTKNLSLEDNDDEDIPVSRKVRTKRKRSELVEDFIKSTMAKKGKQVRDMHRTKVLPHLDGVLSGSVSAANTTVALVHCASSPKTPEEELWVHEDCAVWSHGIHLLGPRVIGLSDAISEASKLLCVKCHEGGATVGCLHKGCSEQFHYICAIEKGCQLNEENFTIFCAKHRRKPEPNVT